MTIEDLRELADSEKARQEGHKNRILYCSAAGCNSCGADATKAALTKSLKENGLDGNCEVLGTGCMGLCGEGPLVKLQSDESLYQRVDEGAAKKIVEEHILHGTKVKENLVDTSAPFFASQQKIVLENCGRINAESIEEESLSAATMPLQKSSTSSSRLKSSKKSARADCAAEEEQDILPG